MRVNHDPPPSRRLYVDKHGQFNERSRLDAALALISPSKKLKHSGATLWSHLIGTYEILSAWGAPREVCLAGALHSIYATEFFRSQIVAENRRGEVTRIVGKRAEHLAHAFCILDRNGIRDAAQATALHSDNLRVARHDCQGIVRLGSATVRNLRLIDLANEVEQMQRLSVGPEPGRANLARAFREIGFLPAALPPEAVATSISTELVLLRSYAEGLTTSTKRAQSLFEQCVAAVPCCAEPRLMLAAHHLEAGRQGAAYIHASTALAHLRGWASAWDTRIPFLAWELLGLQLTEAARLGERKAPSIAEQIREKLRGTLAKAQ